MAPTGNTRLSLLMSTLSPKPSREGQQCVEQPPYTAAVPCSEAARTAPAPQVGGVAQAGVRTGAGKDAGIGIALQDRPVSASAPETDLLALGNCQASTQVDPSASIVQLLQYQLPGRLLGTVTGA